jgi:iron complex transport system permease protein
MHQKVNMLVVLVVLIFVAIISMLFGVGIGSTSIAPVTTMKVILSHLPGFSLWFPVSDIATDAIVWDIRFPRVILALFIGSALAVAGAALQGLLCNPLAEPYTIGVHHIDAITDDHHPGVLHPLFFLFGLGCKDGIRETLQDMIAICDS